MARTTPVSRLVLTLFFLGISASAFAQVSGAIFTTVQNGTRVNANIYQEKCGANGVWLDGGPGPNAPQGAAGLPDGDYYFQVTDPSGKTLLSTDAVVNRQFHVSGGIISGLSGAGNHNTGVDVDHGATTIELCPFNDTPNSGGVYKAWVTPVGQFAGNPNLVDNSCGHGCFHGFVPRYSKTDNFKIRSGAGGACLEMLKLIDANGNGFADEGEDIVNWPITIVDPLGATNTFWTPTVKECTFSQLVPGTYTVTEGTNANYVVTATVIDGQYQRNADVTAVVRIRNNATREVGFLNAPK
jgi:hypothetical protein